MSDLTKAQEIMAAAMAAKETEEPEVLAVKQLIKLLDKASKNVRTFGPANPVSQRFFEQFYESLTTHLGTYASVSFLVQRSELFFRDVPVYGSSTDLSTENLAFKLYADGIRELTFHDGMSRDDLSFFLDALWGGSIPESNDDDDIVTRLWEQNLPTVTIVTADEAMKLSDAEAALTPQDQTLNSSPSSLHAIAQQERANVSTDAKKAIKPQGSFSGYEITQAETANLAEEITEESKRDSKLYILDILTAILASEQSPTMIDKLIDTFDGFIESLTQQGQWAVLETVLLLFLEVESIRPDLNDEQKQKLRSVFDKIGSPDRLRLIEQYLNKNEKPVISGLESILLMMPSSCIPALCLLLGNLSHLAHQALVAEVIAVSAKGQPEPVLRSLTDRRPAHIRNILGILGKWANCEHAETVEKLLRHSEASVRREAVKTLALIKPNGNAVKLIGLLSDADEGVRLATFKLLLSGSYTIPSAAWEPIMTAENFSDRPPAEKRNLFHAMRCTAGDEAVPYLTGILTDWGWTNRKRREDLALLAADTLGKLATPAAIAALQTGQQKGSATVKQACTSALRAVARQSAPEKCIRPGAA